ncbi:efflux RND transporter periplasmic adaptor subunit [Methylobacterium sp. J-068]|uniref:efflux RND transporter periplasmic adaptor subunit n=1 Tax=Methylobacterium sp. J-068 TaxID=2836649 RepID=UPI001FBAAB15|nr:efflux RND transporter periplasmic adaptor subunit [Methylobacterium sp. J-068]MCJ2036625.1 efflux RND transporter periplasmic adaptor subunit [Methylobacterium sp. J-068]
MIRSVRGVLALVAVLGACQASEEPKAPPPVRPVLFRVVKPVDHKAFGPFAGVVAPRYQSEIGFQIAGRMIARDVTMGDIVRKGQRIAALDPVVTRFALTRAEADLADAKAQAENANATEIRRRRLFGGGNVTQAQLDTAVAGRDTAQARLAQAEANLQKARDQMGYTELHADFDGVVTVRSAEVGQMLSAGQAVATLARPEEREAVVDIPEELVGTMPTDAQFTVALQSAPEVTATARVRETAPFADPTTRTRRIRMTLVKPSEAFRLGSTLTVTLMRAEPPHVDLPATALLTEGGRDSVWLVAEDGRSVRRQAVTVAHREGDRVSIGDGLKAGDRVVLAGIHTLKEGQAVRLSDTAP